MARLAEEFINNIKPKLINKFKYKNHHQVPKITKIVLNIGIREAKEDSKILDKSQEELSLIAGQKAIITLAKKAIATYSSMKLLNKSKNSEIIRQKIIS